MNGPAVSRYVLDLVRRQVEEHGLVIWFDPDRHYEGLLAHLEGEVQVAAYAGSFFALRRLVDPQLRGERPPKFLVYVPLAQSATGHALVELTAAGAVRQPGQQPWQRNTRLTVVAEAALRSLVGPEAAERIARQVESRGLSLAELDQLGGHQAVAEILRLVYGADSAVDVALAFVAGTARDPELAERGGLRGLHDLLVRRFGLAGATPDVPDELRQSLVRHVLLVDLATAIPEAYRPPELARLLPASTDQRWRARAWHGRGGSARTCRTAMWSLPAKQNGACPYPWTDSRQKPSRTWRRSMPSTLACSGACWRTWFGGRSPQGRKGSGSGACGGSGRRPSPSAPQGGSSWRRPPASCGARPRCRPTCRNAVTWLPSSRATPRALRRGATWMATTAASWT
jgi:hypothetical protein